MQGFSFGAPPGKLRRVVIRLPLGLLMLLVALLIPAALASAQDSGTGATIAAQDEDATDDTGATDAGTDDADTNGDGVVDCVDFSTQEDAQIYFDANSDDEEVIAVFDDDGNGVACEELVSSDDPTGAVDSGDGGTAFAPLGSDDGATGGASRTGTLLVLVALLTGAAGLALLARRPGTR